MKVSWKAVEMYNATSYIVLAMSKDGTTMPRAAVTKRLPITNANKELVTHIQTSGLTPGVEYTFQVAAINVNTHGIPSASSDPVEIPRPVGHNHTETWVRS